MRLSFAGSFVLLSGVVAVFFAGRDLSGRVFLLGCFVVAVFCCWEVLFLLGGF